MDKSKFSYAFEKTLSYIPQNWKYIFPIALIAYGGFFLCSGLPGFYLSSVGYSPEAALISKDLTSICRFIETTIAILIEISVIKSIIQDTSKFPGAFESDTPARCFYRVLWAKIKTLAIIAVVIAIPGVPAYYFLPQFYANALMVLMLPLFLYVFARVHYLAGVFAALGKKDTVRASWELSKDNAGYIIFTFMAFILVFFLGGLMIEPLLLILGLLWPAGLSVMTHLLEPFVETLVSILASALSSYIFLALIQKEQLSA